MSLFSGATLNAALQELGATEEQLPEIKDFYTRVFFEDVSDIHLYSNVIPETPEKIVRIYFSREAGGTSAGIGWC